MKQTILCMTFCVMFGLSSSLVTAQPTPPAGAPQGAPAAPGGRGPGGGAPGGPGGFGRGGGRGQQPLGPAAPVPPQVAAPRPSYQELTQINAELQKLLDSPSTPALLKKNASLITLSVPRPTTNPAATFTETGPRVGDRHAAFLEIAQKGDIDLLLQGDSITDNWDSSAANKAVMDKYFGKYKTANFGVGGDITQGVLWGMKNGEAQGFQPKAIMLMNGTNNTGGNTAPEIAEGIGAIVMEMRKGFPNAKILLLAIFPRGNPGERRNFMRPC